MIQDKRIKETLREIALESSFLHAVQYLFDQVDKNNIPEEIAEIYAKGLLYHTQSLKTKLNNYFIGNSPIYPGVISKEREKGEADHSEGHHNVKEGQYNHVL